MIQKIIYKKDPNTKEQLDKILHPIVKKWFYSRFEAYSKPQLFSVLDIHSRKNILISAPTGATKTLTGFMAILNELVDSSQRGILEDRVHCIYISPLKALNNDIEKNILRPLEEMEKIANKKLGIRVAVRTGDTTSYQKSKMTKNPPHILITTPESLGIVLSSIKFREHLRGVSYLIVDEIHALAENKRGVHLSLSMERLQHISPAMTRIGLSATVAPLDEIAKYLVGTKRDCGIVNVQYIKDLDLQVISPVSDLINISHEKLQHKLYTKMHSLIDTHKTTLIFTNTRAATERVVDHLKEMYPKKYTVENIGAHHGSLSKEHRTELEENLRNGKLKVVVCSTSLELGIDIGYIDLVICLGSPKSVARALQRIGRAGHQLHSVTKGRIIVLDRDDLVECSVLLRSAIKKQIDRIDIPHNALDVLAQQIFGMSFEQVWEEDELYQVIKQSYCYHNLKRSHYDEILQYLSGEFVSLEERYVYAKIWRKEGKIGKRGRMSRVIYMTNIGTIPDTTGMSVKLNGYQIGSLDESFLERLKPGDIFVLGGNTYEFKYARGTVVTVKSAVARPPTVPSWISEMLPLSFDLAMEASKFRRLMEGYFSQKKTKKEILSFIEDYLYVDKKATLAIYNYFYEQYYFLKEIPHDKKIIVEHYTDEYGNTKITFHSLFGRRVNDVLSRAIAFALSRVIKRDVEVGMNDNGFYLGVKTDVQVKKALSLLHSEELPQVMRRRIDKSEVLRRRFRHCAGRSYLILRNYAGRKKRVGRQQVSSSILMSAVKRINPDFCILEEARREVLEDLMDIQNAVLILSKIESKEIEIKEIKTTIPSPFAFKIVLQGVIDIIKLEDKMEFLQRMHKLVIAKISLNKGKEKKSKINKEKEDFSYLEHWKKEEEEKLQRESEEE